MCLNFLINARTVNKLIYSVDCWFTISSKCINRTLNHYFLRAVLQQSSPRVNFEQHFQQQLAETIATAWLLATSEDLRWPTVKLRGASPNPRLYLLRGYLDLVLYAAIVEPKIAQAYFSLIILATPLHSLISPRIAAHIRAVAYKRVIKRLLRGEDSWPSSFSRGALHNPLTA